LDDTCLSGISPTTNGVSMSQPAEPVRLTDDDVDFLVSVLRNASEPLPTRALIEALRNRKS
jgi:hypothetical protein